MAVAKFGGSKQWADYHAARKQGMVGTIDEETGTQTSAVKVERYGSRWFGEGWGVRSYWTSLNAPELGEFPGSFLYLPGHIDA